ncbi:MAG TPA: hypothetical protein VFL53_20810 [Pseudolabrys sp.]|nr:hypothetical protein [Pseudolabrys sp.]
MKFVTIAFASAIALSAAAPAFAYENELETVVSTSRMQPGEHQAAGMHANSHRAFDARAYAPAPAPVVTPYDFGIGSQS